MAITRLNIFGLAGALALAACSGPAPADPDGDPGATVVTQHLKLYDIRIEAGRRTRRHVGWLEHRHPVDEPTGGKYFVLGLDRKRLGFVLPLGGAYRYEFEDGRVTGTEELGHGGLSGGIGRVLGLAINELEMAPVDDPPPAPAAPQR